MSYRFGAKVSDPNALIPSLLLGEKVNACTESAVSNGGDGYMNLDA